MKVIKPVIRRADAIKFKVFLHKSVSTSFLLVKKAEGASKSLFGSLKKNWSEIKRLNNDGWDVYMAVNGQSGPRRVTDNICKVNALFIDYDKGDWNAKDFDRFVSKFPVKPQFVTQSSPGCFHVYWLIEDVPLECFGKTQKQLAEKYGADPKVCDLPRVMRVPGTINWKRESKFVAKVVYLDKQARPLTYARFVQEMFSGQNVVVAPVRPKPDAKQNLEAISDALASIPSDDRQVWVTVGMALKNGLGDAGQSLFMNWSSGSTKYDELEAVRQWRSFKADGGIALGTLFHLAKQMRYGTTPLITSGGDYAPTNNLALANQFAETVADCLRYCEDQKSWFVAKYSRWQKSNKGAERVAINFLQGMLK